MLLDYTHFVHWGSQPKKQIIAADPVKINRHIKYENTGILRSIIVKIQTFNKQSKLKRKYF